MKNTVIASLALIAATTTFGTPAIAAPFGPEVSLEVRTDDLDLGTAAGRTRLDARVGRAARQICALSERGFAAIEAEKRCVALAMKSAAPQVDLAVAHRVRPVQLAIATPAPRG